MTQAPERIWIEGNAPDKEVGYWSDRAHRCFDTPYVRADLCPNATTVRAEALREAAETVYPGKKQTGLSMYETGVFDAYASAYSRILALIDTPTPEGQTNG